MGEVENGRLRKGLSLGTVYMVSRCQLAALDLYFPQLDCKVAEGRDLFFWLASYHCTIHISALDGEKWQTRRQMTA